MILTVTMNPSLDHSYITGSFKLGKMNRFPQSCLSIGGKGVNAGRVAALAGSEVLLTGFLGGEIGHVIENTLQRQKRLTLGFLALEENSRNAITIMHDNGTHTEIVEKGPLIDGEAEARLHHHLRCLFTDYPHINAVCICGSVNSANPRFYADLLDQLKTYIPAKLPILMDISGTQLLNVLNSANKPTFIKPNVHELEEILHAEFTGKETIHEALRDPIFDGIDTVMVSCGGDGALVKTKDRLLDVSIPAIDVVNTTGCGDATVGGLAHCISNEQPLTKAVTYAMACGMSNAGFSTNGMIDPGDADQYCEKITVTELKAATPL